MNPVRAGLVEDPEHYLWSSAKAHISNNFTNTILSGKHLSEICLINDWRSFLNENSDKKKVKHLKLSTSTGRPTGQAVKKVTAT